MTIRIEITPDDLSDNAKNAINVIKQLVGSNNVILDANERIGFSPNADKMSEYDITYTKGSHDPNTKITATI